MSRSPWVSYSELAVPSPFPVETQVSSPQLTAGTRYQAFTSTAGTTRSASRARPARETASRACGIASASPSASTATTVQPHSIVMLWLPKKSSVAPTSASAGSGRSRSARSTLRPAASISGSIDTPTNSLTPPRP
jgi:hypothetical protein